jgi:hypothetical protein
MNPLIVVGSAPCTQEDLASLPPMEADYMLIGLDSVEKYLGHVQYMATHHPAEIQQTTERRRKAGGNTDWRTISHEKRPGVDIVTPLNGKPSGSSAMLGILTALKLGYNRIICCGCPLTGDKKYESFHRGWTSRLDLIKDNVRSCSGWTRDLIGEPTEEWLNG